MKKKFTDNCKIGRKFGKAMDIALDVLRKKPTEG